MRRRYIPYFFNRILDLVYFLVTLSSPFMVYINVLSNKRTILSNKWTILLGWNVKIDVNIDEYKHKQKTRVLKHKTASKFECTDVNRRCQFHFLQLVSWIIKENKESKIKTQNITLHSSIKTYVTMAEGRRQQASFWIFHFAIWYISSAIWISLLFHLPKLWETWKTQNLIHSAPCDN